MADEPFPDTEEGRHRRLRTRLFRRLLDDPVVYYSELSEEEREYFVSQRPSVVKEIESATGLAQEARQEGVARSEEHTSELQSRLHLVCRLLLEKKKHKHELVSMS